MSKSVDASRGLIRQGDLLLIPTDPDIADGAAPGRRRDVEPAHGRLVLAEGEATGHAHAILDGHARLEVQEYGESREVWINRRAWSDSRTVLIVEGAPATLVHEEHDPLTVPPGGYVVRRQREYVPSSGRERGLEEGRRLMPAGDPETAARSIRFGPLDRASGKLDRTRAEKAIGAATTRSSRLVWAQGLTEAVQLVAGRSDEPLFALLGYRPRDWPRTLRPSGRAPERERVEHVAAIDEKVLVAARHAAAGRIPAEERLAFRMSVPRATVVSSLALSALESPDWAINAKALALASELARAGVLALWLLDDGDAVVVPRPDMSVVDEDLHALDRPAVCWAEESLWFWHGVWIPDHLAARREHLGPAEVLAERNAERRRILVDAIGFEALARAASGGAPVQEDDYGRLWRLGPLLDDEEYVAVEVVDSTPEPDGSYRRYFLRVPPKTKTARAGVAWTFEMSVRDYTIAAQS